jgi:hypothetical protein
MPNSREGLCSTGYDGTCRGIYRIIRLIRSTTESTRIREGTRRVMIRRESRRFAAKPRVEAFMAQGQDRCVI